MYVIKKIIKCCTLEYEILRQMQVQREGGKGDNIINNNNTINSLLYTIYYTIIIIIIQK